MIICGGVVWVFVCLWGFLGVVFLGVLAFGLFGFAFAFCLFESSLVAVNTCAGQILFLSSK